jgi:hypothetical protein
MTIPLSEQKTGRKHLASEVNQILTSNFIQFILYFAALHHSLSPISIYIIMMLKQLCKKEKYALAFTFY